MKNRIKSYWSNCLSIAAIICSVVAICVSLPSEPEIGIDYIGVIVGILSLLVTMLIGWQIYNVITIDKRIEDKVNEVTDSFEKDIKKIKDENEISLKKALYKAEYLELKIQLTEHYPEGVTKCLKTMTQYAIDINNPTYFNEIAKYTIHSKEEICRITIINNNNNRILLLNNDLIEISQSLLNHLTASDQFAPALLKIVNELKKYNERIQT